MTTRSTRKKHSGSEPSGQKSAELLVAWRARLLVWRSHKTYQDAWDESRRTASVEEAKRGVAADPDTRPLDPSGSSMDPEPKRTKTTSVTDNENLAGLMDEDNSQGPERPLILWNLSTMKKTCQRRHEWQETSFTSGARMVSRVFTPTQPFSGIVPTGTSTPKSGRCASALRMSRSKASEIEGQHR